MISFRRHFDPHTIRLLIFDLDGTLIDSRLDLIQSINAMLRHLERPELPGELIATYVGDGAPMLVRRALGEVADESLVQSAIEYFLGYYRLHKLDHTTIYEGVIPALAAIAAPPNGVHRIMAVLSNKPVNPSRDILIALDMAPYFVRVYGGNSFPTKKRTWVDCLDRRDVPETDGSETYSVQAALPRPIRGPVYPSRHRR